MITNNWIFDCIAYASLRFAHHCTKPTLCAEENSNNQLCMNAKSETVKGKTRVNNICPTSPLSSTCFITVHSIYEFILKRTNAC